MHTSEPKIKEVLENITAFQSQGEKIGKEKRTDNSEGLNKSHIGYKRLETDVYIKLPMEWWNHTDRGTNLAGKSYGEQTETGVGSLFSTSQLREVAAAATANDEYHMLARDIASVLCCVGLGRYV